MNETNAFIEEVLSEPKKDGYKAMEWWELEVKVDCHGRIREKTLFFKSKEEAEKICEDDKIVV